MDGLEIFKGIQDIIDYHLPIIMLSAHGTIRLVSSFLKAGGADFEEKPIDFDVLQIKIERALQSSTLIRKEIKYRKDAETALQKSHDELDQRVMARTAELEKSNALLKEQISLRNEAEQTLKKHQLDLEQIVEKRTAELRTAYRELETFSYSISHDLSTPLRHIDGYLNLLRHELGTSPNKTAQTYMDNIIHSVRFMNTLIEGLLSFSKLGRKKLTKTDIDANTLIHEALNSVSQGINNRNIQWSIPAFPTIFGDIVLLKTVWVNLFSNAIKFTRYKKVAKIELSCQNLDSEFVFSIKDNGIGFDMRYASKLFGVFQRLHSKETFEGSGIGLATVKRIIEHHGGRTWAESEPDKGTTIFFSLPKKPTEMADAK